MSGKEVLEGPSWKWVAMLLIAVLGFFGSSFYSATVTGERELIDRLNHLENKLNESISQVRGIHSQEFMGLEFRVRRLEEKVK